MRNATSQHIVLFIAICTLVILVLVAFISIIIYKYQQNQNSYYKGIEELKKDFGNDILKSQLEIQEQTFQNISQEIHDNIGQKLTLAKLHLNTLNLTDITNSKTQLHNVVQIIGESIKDLSDLSRSMSSEIILNNGLVKALEFEVGQLIQPGIYDIKMIVTGEPLFMEAQKELILFRIVQEALNNIVKHVDAKQIVIELDFRRERLMLSVIDNGKGFDANFLKQGNGLANMAKRATLLNGKCVMNSKIGVGTTINIQIPLYE